MRYRAQKDPETAKKHRVKKSRLHTFDLDDVDELIEGMNPQELKDHIKEITKMIMVEAGRHG